MSATCVENSSTNSCANPRGESSTAKETFKRSFPREIDIEKAHLKHARHVFVTHDDALKFPMRPPVHSELPRPASTPPRARVSRSVYPPAARAHQRYKKISDERVLKSRSSTPPDRWVTTGHVSDRPNFPGDETALRPTDRLDGGDRRRSVVASSRRRRRRRRRRARAPEFKRRLRHAQRPRGGVRRE